MREAWEGRTACRGALVGWGSLRRVLQWGVSSSSLPDRCALLNHAAFASIRGLETLAEAIGSLGQRLPCLLSRPENRGGSEEATPSLRFRLLYSSPTHARRATARAFERTTPRRALPREPTNADSPPALPRRCAAQLPPCSSDECDPDPPRESSGKGEEEVEGELNESGGEGRGRREGRDRVSYLLD